MSNTISISHSPEVSGAANHHSYSATVAKLYGVEAAIVFGYLVRKIHNSQVFYMGKTWYRENMEELCITLGYLDEASVSRALNHLIDKGVLIRSQFGCSDVDATWISVRGEQTADMANENRVYFKVIDALNYGVLKAVLLNHLRSEINTAKMTAPGYCMHYLKPSALAIQTSFCESAIERALDALIHEDGVLVAMTDLEPPPTKYGFADKVSFREEYDIVR